MIRLWKSVAFRLAVFCGALVIGSVTIFSTIFYFGTIRVLIQDVDRKITSISERLSDKFETRGLEALHGEIDAMLSDKFDVDTEIYYLAGADGRKITGNLSDWNELSPPLDRSIDRNVLRDGKPSSARLLLHKMPDGSLLIVGRDMKDINEITYLVWRTIGIGCVVALMLAVGGTIIFRYLLERRVGAIRKTVEEIEAGRLDKRIPISGVEDEFARLSREMNRMLDRIEHLMDGVRHVSNTIAHNLRTPLGRIRGHLDEALRNADASRLANAAEFSIEQIDSLIAVFDKLLQIAESESGIRRQPFKTVALKEVVTDVVELYDAIAEEKGITLVANIEGNPTTPGDKDLLTSALANLLDNAFKYGGHSVAISARVTPDAETVTVVVQDDGPGIPPDERSKVIQRFYRLDQNVPGTGLGLSIVDAIAHLHGASLHLEDASPGLLARLVLPPGASH
jgi:signal transduction histidine kinase